MKNRKPYLDMTPEEQNKVFLQHRIYIILAFIVDVVFTVLIVRGVQL